MTEPTRHRPTAGVAAVLASLDERLENEAEVLDALLLALARNQLPKEAWSKLQEAAKRDDRITELAFAFEALAADRKLRTLQAGVVAEFMFQSSVFFGDVMGDDLGAANYLDRAMTALPTHAGSLARFEEKLTEQGDFARLGEFFFDMAQHRARTEQPPLLRRAVEAFEKAATGAQPSNAGDRLADVLTLLVRVDPKDDAARAKLEDALLHANRPRDVAKMLEQSLAADPPPTDDEAFAHRTKLIALYEEVSEIERALPHVEWLLARAPGHEGAKSIGIHLLEVKACAQRAAAALALAAEKSESWADAIRFYTLELESARGPRRFGSLRALAALKHDHTEDLAGAWESAEQALLIDSTDGDLLERFVALTRGLGKHEAAQKTLQRLTSVAKDPSARARLSAEMGELLLATGDVKRARAAFSSALTVPGATDLAVLPAMHALARLYIEDEDHVSLAEMLERIMNAEPDIGRRQQAAEQLAELASGALGDPARAVAAYRGLLDTQARPRALAALEPLLASLGDAIGLAEILRTMANDAPSRDEKRALLVRAAEQLTEASGNVAVASRAWRDIIEEFGATKDALTQWLPLLELERDFSSLANAYDSLAKLEHGGEKVAALARLGMLRLQWLEDPHGAVEAFRGALAIDPHDETSRDAMERMLEGVEPRLALEAAEVLEPIYRSENARPGLLRVLLARAQGSADLEERGRALESAVSLAESASDRGRVVQLVKTALAQALDEARPVAPWISALDRLASGEAGAGERMDVLALALGDRAVSSDEMLLVAQRLGDAALLAGDRARALDAYKRALDFSPSSPELMAGVDLLLREQGTPHDRVRLYRSALSREGQIEKRRALHLAIATLQRKDLSDAGGAMETLRTGLAEGPDDAMEDALYELFCETGAFADACALLEQRLPRTPPGADERTLRARLAKLASDHGLRDRSVVHAKALAEDAFANAADLDLVEQIAERAEDRDLLVSAALKRVELAEAADDKVFWLTRLGTLHTERGDAVSAASAWRDAAQAAEEMGDRKAARKLYERVRRGAPFDRTATERLAALVETSGDWPALPELYAALVESASTPIERKVALLKLADVLQARMNDAPGAFDAAARAFLEAPGDADALAKLIELASAANATQALMRTIDGALGGDAGRDPTLRARLLAAKAEVISTDVQQADEARALLRAVIDDPFADVSTKDRAASRFEEILSRGEARGEADAWRWLFSWRVSRESGLEQAAALARFARLEEEKLGDVARAIDLWKRASAADHASAEAPAEIARLMIASGDVDGALSTLRARLDGADAQTASRLRAEIAALLASIRGREHEAMNELRATLTARPDDEPALRLLVQLLPHAEIGEEASRLLEASLEAADAAGRKRVLGALVKGATDAPVDRRRTWHTQLLDGAESQDEAYAVLLRALAELPAELAWWDRAEQLARRLDRPQELSDLYQAAITKPIATEDALELGQRAVAFHEEWFDDAAAVIRILERMVDLDPAGWAFDRLKLLYDSQERWDELFTLYDRILAGELEATRRTELLEDAAQIAKDFAKNAERAVGYLEQLLQFKPKNERLLASLERLYERHGKHRELIGLLGAQLGGKNANDAHALRVRMATLWLDELGDAGSALLVVEEMMQAGETGDDVIALLERVLTSAPVGEEMKKTLPPTASPLSERVAAAHDSSAPPHASVPPRASVPPPGGKSARGNKRVLVRQRAASLLRERYAELERDADLARMLEVELEAVKNAKERIRRHGEVAALHERLGNDAAALEHAVSLAMLDPDATSHRERLARLADKTGRFDRLAEVLAAAADDCEGDELRATLLLDSASVYAEKLGDASRAIDLLGRLLQLDVTHAALLAAARRLDALLAASERRADRLVVLERLASLEEDDPHARRDALGAAARLAGEIGESDRSIAAWEARLRHDGADLEALDGLVVILGASGKTRALVDALVKRASVQTDVAASRDDRVRAARILSSELDAAEEAIDVWEAIRDQSGEADDVNVALAELYERRERWKDLAGLLERTAERSEDADTKASLLSRLGDVRRAKTDAPKKAIESYARSLDARPGNAPAIAGLTALLDVDNAARKALDVLLRDHSSTGSWAAIVALLPQRLRLAKNDSDRVDDLLETADLFETRANDLEAAFHASREAFTLAAGDERVATIAERLADSAQQAGAQGTHRALADAHRAVIDASDDRKGSARDVLRLRTKLGAMLETHLDDARGALAQFTRVATDDPANESAALSLIRVAGTVARWDAATKIVIDRAAIAGGPDETLLHALEDAATAHAGWDALTAAFEAALAERHADTLAREASRDLEARLAAWHRDRRADAEAAEAAFTRALAHDPNDTHLLLELAQLQRRHRGRPLIDSLLRLSQATGGDPELLREAAEIAGRVVVDRSLAKSILERLMKLASERWTSSEDHPPSTQSPDKDGPVSIGTLTHPSEHVEWALAELLRVHNEEGNAERIVEVLEESARLPFTPVRARELLHEAGRTALDRVGDTHAAQRLYARLFADDPRDDEAATRLADVYATLGRKEELLALRRKQIEVASDANVRVGHRLEAALLERELGRIDEAATLLRENFADAPRHARSTLVLSETLEQATRWDELAAFCAEQAALAEADGDVLSAVELWSRAASIAEEKLQHFALALANYKRSLALELRAPLLDAIARIHERQQEWLDAATHLDRLVRELPEQRPIVIVRLADAFVKAQRDDAAQERLEGALSDPASPPLVAVRLMEIYRRTGQYAPLGELIARQADAATSDADRRAALVEAAEIFLTRCATPERAVPLLERASTLAPDDRPLRLRLAEALQEAGHAEQARVLLRDMIDAFAGRRPKERATVHFHLARLHLRIGERAQALAELEAATKIDPANPEILRMVAELARDDGQLDKAERSYRALLAVVRRADDDAPVLRTEVLVELSALAERQGEAERAAEIIESAFETAASSDAEAKRLEKALAAKGNTQGLLRSLRARLARAADASARADVLGELARAHSTLGDLPAALRAQLDAVAEIPTSAAAHDAAMALATKAGTPDAYVEALAALADRVGAAGDPRATCALLLRAADALTLVSAGSAEGGMAQTQETASPTAALERAAKMLERARETNAMQSDVLRALDRVYATLGDAEKQEAVLAELASLEAESTSRDPRTAAEILYRLAELRAKRKEGVDDAARALSTALELSPDAERAMAIARDVVARDFATAAMLDLFVRAARVAGRDDVIRSAVLLRAERDDAPLATIREAATLALQSSSRPEDGARADSLLDRLAAGAKDDHETLRWALLERAALLAARGDASRSLALELEAASHCDAAEARRIRDGVALRSRQVGEVALELRARREIAAADPADVGARAGLLDLLRTTGDAAALLEVVEALLPSVTDDVEKRALRRERARLLSAQPERVDEVLAELRALLDEEPYDAHAVALLAELLEARGETGELSTLLERQLDAAKDRQDASGVAVLSMRLGALVEAHDETRARELYTAGLDWEPKNRPLLLAMRRLLANGGDVADRADVMERLLDTETGEAAEALALELATSRAEQWDDAGVERALELGLKGHPASEELRRRLIASYEDRGDRRKLAALKETTARAMNPSEAKTELLSAASIHRDLGDAEAAARALHAARAIDPTDEKVLAALAAALEHRGDEHAATELCALVDATSSPHVLAARARVLASLGRHADAIADAERVHAIDIGAGNELLLVVLGRAADAADATDQKPLRRRAAELYAAAGRSDEAHAQLELLLSLDENDRDTLWAMAQLEEASGRFDAASDTYVRLVDIEVDERVIEAALRLADASTRANNAGYARAGLEKARALAPEDDRILEKLSAVYAAIGAHRELAELRLAAARAATDPARRFEMLSAAGSALLEHDPIAAAQALEEARTLKPADVEVTGLLADAYIGAQRFDEARDLLQAVVVAQKGRRSRDLAQIHLRLGRLEIALSNPRGAMQSFTTALDMDGQNGVVASELAHVALSEGEMDLATRALRAITMLRTPAPISKGIAYERLGEIAMHQGDNKRAVMLLKRALDEDATLEHARELLAQLGG